MRPPWKKGQSGNPKGRPRRKTMEELVETELDATIKDGGTRRELLARKIVAQMLSNKGGDALLKEYLRRVWPEVHKAEVRAEVDMNAEIDLAAQELRAMLGGDG